METSAQAAMLLNSAALLHLRRPRIGLKKRCGGRGGGGGDTARHSLGPLPLGFTVHQFYVMIIHIVVILVNQFQVNRKFLYYF